MRVRSCITVSSKTVCAFEPRFFLFFFCLFVCLSVVVAAVFFFFFFFLVLFLSVCVCVCVCVCVFQIISLLLISYCTYLKHFVCMCVNDLVQIFFCLNLFELMLYVPVNSQGHVGTLPPHYGTFTQNEDVMTSNKCLKYPSNQAKKAYMYGRFDLKPLFLGKLRPERITSNQMVSQ